MNSAHAITEFRTSRGRWEAMDGLKTVRGGLIHRPAIHNQAKTLPGA